jgi:hypothetical protein
MIAAWEDAIKRGDVQIVLDLLGRGIDADARDRYGQTALMLAAHAGHREVVETLIAHRADLNVTAKYGLNALMLALIAHGCERTRSTGRRSPPASRRGPVPPDTNRRRRDFARIAEMLAMREARLGS